MRSRAIFALVLLLGSPSASAQGPRSGAPPARVVANPNFQIASVPVVGPAVSAAASWSEMLVVLRNTGTDVRRGSVLSTSSVGMSERGVSSRTAFEVAPGAVAELRLPARLTPGWSEVVEVWADSGELLYQAPIPFDAVFSLPLKLLDVAGSPGLSGELSAVTVVTESDARLSALLGAPSSTVLPSRGLPHGWLMRSVTVSGSPRESATDEPILPLFSASYALVDAVLIRSDALARLPARELAALTGWALAGGTIAVVVTRPEDLRNATLMALVGGEVTPAPVAPETLAYIALPALPPGASARLPLTDQPLPEALRSLVSGYQGGNLRPSPVGATASYGLGELHLLAVDPTVRPAVDTPWALVRVLEVLRRASARQASVLFHIGQAPRGSAAVSHFLDPNEASRWTIGVALLLLSFYAILAGPVNFMVWRRRGSPLKSLPTLLVASAASFLAIGVLAAATKGLHGRVAHLTFAELGAGVSTGAVRRWRGFFVPRSRSMSIHASESNAVLETVRASDMEASHDAFVLDRDALRLAELRVRAWAVDVVRQDGLVSLGEGVAMVREASGSTAIVNRTGRALRGLILSEPGKPTAYLARLETGGRVGSSAFASWNVSKGESCGTRLCIDFASSSVSEELDTRVAGLGAAWDAVRSEMASPLDWFPVDVPTLLAEVEGGEGTLTDSGLPVEAERFLVRIVGYGGAP